MKRSLIPAAVLLMLGLSRIQAEEPNQLTENEKLAGWKLLFDGKSTRGWHTYKQKELNPGWVVEDGAIVRKAKGAGDLTTDGERGRRQPMERQRHRHSSYRLSTSGSRMWNGPNLPP